MKLLKLTINAFGPFVDKTVINFNDFGNNGLFLITGDTGAGKTTIFDAITFALFGSASGSTRNNVSALRSDFADEDNRTFVELEFSNKGEKYTIARKAQHKKSNRKTRLNEEFSLICPCGTILTQTDATNKIQEIIGLDKSQFAQIVMLAQGEFQRLLNSNTKDRREIFQKIFKTFSLYTFQQKLKLRADMEKGNFKALENSIIQYVEGIDIDNAIETLIFEKQSFLSAKNCYNLDSLLELLNQSNGLDNEKLVKLQKDLDENNKRNEEIVKQIEAATTIENNRKTLASIIENLPNLEEELNSKKLNYEKEKAKEEERNSIAVQIDKIEKTIPKYEELSKFEKELKLGVEDLTTSESSLKTLKETFEKTQKEYIENKNSIKIYLNVDVEIEQLNNKKKENTKEKENIKDIQNKLNKLAEKRKELETSQVELLESTKDYEEKSLKADKLYKEFICNQAGIIAQNIKDGDKCPVCGSTNHPCLAVLSSENITQDAVDRAKKDTEISQTTCNQKSQIAAKLKAELDEQEKNILEKAKADFKILTIERLKEELPLILNRNNVDLETLKSLEEKLTADSKEKQKLLTSIENFEKSEVTNKATIQKLDDENSKKKEAVNTLTTKITETKKNLEFKSEDEANKKLKELKKQQNLLKENLEKLEKTYNEALTSYNQTIGQKKELENNLKGQKVIDIKKLNTDKVQLDEIIKQLNDDKTKVYSRHQTNSTALKNLMKSKKELKVSDSKRNVFQNLSDTANGCLDNKLKLTFENFVLSKYFKQILVAANKRFKAITYNQFEFKHSEDSKGNAYIGLDINVFDSYTGKERPVSTLSGGESFKAALSLALGLSDIIQQQVGGVQIDTMFIDEGFGSLDSDSLEQTMKILMELSNNETLIGIISHVAELREKIDRKIIVSKDKKGSSIKIEIP